MATRRHISTVAIVALLLILAIDEAHGGKLWSVTVETVPSGARMEFKGQTLGTTPYTVEYPRTYFRAPRTILSKRLGEPVVVVFYKAGFLAKTVELTHGPFLWRSLNGQNAFIYYTLDRSYTIHLEPVPTYDNHPTRNEKRQTQLTHGTAFHCSTRGVLITNYHVIENTTDITVSLEDDKCSATVVMTDKANDLAVLRVDPVCGERLRLGVPLRLGSSSSLSQGDNVLTYGYPLPTEFAEEPQVSTGIVKSTSGLDGDVRTLTISNSVQPGSSGAPLFGPDGSVVGVVTSTLNVNYLYPRYETIPQDLNFAVKSEYVKALLELTNISGGPDEEPEVERKHVALSDSLPNFVENIKRSILLITALSGQSDGRTGIDLSGGWEASLMVIQSDVAEAGTTFTVLFDLKQTDAVVTGTFRTANGIGGTVTGEVKERLFTFTASQGSPCEGHFEGSAQIAGDGQSMSVSYSGSDCNGYARAMGDAARR